MLDGIYELESVESDELNKLPKYIKIQPKGSVYRLQDELYLCSFLLFNSLEEYANNKEIDGFYYKSRIVDKNEIKEPYFYFQIYFKQGYSRKKFEARIRPQKQGSLKATISPYYRKDPKLVGQYSISVAALENFKDSVATNNFKTLTEKFYRREILNYYIGIAEYKNYNFKKAKEYLGRFVKACQFEMNRDYSADDYVFDFEISYVKAMHALDEIDFIHNNVNDATKYVFKRWKVDDSIWPERLLGGVYILCDSNIVHAMDLIKDPTTNKIECQNRNFEDIDQFGNFIKGYISKNNLCK